MDPPAPGSNHAGDRSDPWQLLAVTELDPGVDEATAARFAAARAAEAESPARGLAAWQEVAKTARTCRTPLRAIARLHASLEQWTPMAATLHREISLTPEPASRCALLALLAAVYRDRLNLGVRAASVLKQLIAISPNDLHALAALADLYQRQKRWTEVIAIHERLAVAAPSPAEQAEVWRGIAGLQQERLGKPSQALAAWRRVIELAPGDREAMQALQRDCEARRDFAGLLALQRREVALIADPHQRATRCAELARRAAGQLDQPTTATELWCQVIALEPDHPEALAELEAMCSRSGRWDALATALSTCAEASPRPDQRAHHLAALGRVASQRLGDSDRAIAAWRQVLELVPDQPAAVAALGELLATRGAFAELEALYTEHHRWHDLIATLRAREPTNPHHLLRIAEIYRRELGQEDQAAQAYQQLLAVDPDNLAAAEALIPHLERSGPPAALAAALEVRARHQADPLRRTELLLELITRVERELGQPPALAIGLRGLRRDPDATGLLEAARRLAEATGDWGALAEACATAAPTAAPDASVALLVVAARSFEATGHTDQALDAGQRALALAPGHPDAWAICKRLCEARAAWHTLADLYRTRLEQARDPAEQRPDWLALAALYSRLGRADQATATYHRLLRVDPEDRDVLRALATGPLDAADAPDGLPAEELARIYRDGGHWSALAELLAKSIPDRPVQDRVARLLELAVVAARQLGDPAAASAALADGLAAIDDVTDPELRLSLLLELATTASESGDEKLSDAAIDCAAATDTSDLDQLDRLAATCRAAARWDRLAAVLRRTAALHPSAAERSRCLLAAAAILEHETGDLEGALAAYREARRLQPTCGETTAAVVRLLRALAPPPDFGAPNPRPVRDDDVARWHELAEALRRHALLATTPEQAIATLHELAVLQLDALADPHAAIATCSELLTRRPDDTNAMARLAAAYDRAGMTSQYLQLLARRFDDPEEEHRRGALADQMAEICERQLMRLDLAAAHRRRAWEVAPNEARFRALVRVYRAAEQLDALADLLRTRFATSDDGDTRARLGRELIELLDRPDAAHDDAAEACHLVLARCPDHGPAWQLLATLHERRQAWPEAAACLARLIEVTADATARARAHYRLAGVLRDDPDAAAEQLERALLADPGHRSAALDLAALRGRRDPDGAVELLLGAANAAAAPRDQARLLCAAGDLLCHQLDNDDRAARLYARALDLDPEQREAGLALVAICERTERHQELWHVLERLARHLDPEDRRSHHEVHCKLARTGEALGRYADAIAHYQAAWRIDPSDVATLVAMTALQRRLAE